MRFVCNGSSRVGYMTHAGFLPTRVCPMRSCGVAVVVVSLSWACVSMFPLRQLDPTLFAFDDRAILHLMGLTRTTQIVFLGSTYIRCWVACCGHCEIHRSPDAPFARHSCNMEEPRVVRTCFCSLTANQRRISASLGFYMSIYLYINLPHPPNIGVPSHAFES